MQVSGLVGRMIMGMYIRICLPKPADAQGWQKVLTFRKSPGGWTPLENSVAPESALVSSVQAYSHVPNGRGFRYMSGTWEYARTDDTKADSGATLFSRGVHPPGDFRKVSTFCHRCASAGFGRRVGIHHTILNCYTRPDTYPRP